jgi:hypothetical protein
MGIATRADEAGTKKRGKGVWYFSTILRMLHNTMYKGVYYWNKTRAGREPRDPSEWIEMEIPAILPVELWQAAQHQAAANRKFSPRNVRRAYLMRGRLFCAECKRVLYARSNTRYSEGGWYYCPNTEPARTYDGIKRHNGQQLSSQRVDQEIWEKIRSVLRNPVEFANSQAEALRQFDHDSDQAVLSLAELEHDQGEIEAQEKRLADLYVLGKMSKAVLEASANELGDRLDELNKRKIFYQNILTKAELKRQRAEDTRRFVESICTKLDTLTFEEKRRTIDLLDIRGIVTIRDRAEEDEIRLVIGGLE